MSYNHYAAHILPWLEFEVLYSFPRSQQTHRQDPPHQKLKPQHRMVQEKPTLCAAIKW